MTTLMFAALLLFLWIYADLIELYVEPSKQEHQILRFNNHKFDSIDTSLYLAIHRRREIFEINRQKLNPQNRRKPKPKPNPKDQDKDDDHGNTQKLCSGKPCDNGQNSKNEKKIVKQCSKHTCSCRLKKVCNECKVKTQNKCPYCVARRCSRTLAKSDIENNGHSSKPQAQDQAHVSHPEYNRFTRVARRYPFKGGRSAETRKTGFNRCVLKRIKECRNCRRRSSGRRKRDQPKCDKCKASLSKAKGCSDYNRIEDFYKRKIQEEHINGDDYQLTVKSAGRDSGILLYMNSVDKNNRPSIFIRNVTSYSDSGGVGRALMEYLIEEIAIKRNHVEKPNTKYKVAYVELSALGGRNNTSAWALYNKLGFKVEKESDSPEMSLDLRKYKSGNPDYKAPDLDECVRKKKKASIMKTLCGWKKHCCI